MVDGEGREGWERGILILVSMARWDTYRGLTDSRFKTQFNLFATRQPNPERHHSLSIPAQRHAASQQPAIHADLILIPIPIPIPAQGSRSMEMSHLHCAAPRLPACSYLHRRRSRAWLYPPGRIVGLEA